MGSVFQVHSSDIVPFGEFSWYVMISRGHLNLTVIATSVSSAVVFLYDWIDMLPEEIEFVWTSNLLRPFNVLYMIQRYMPFIDTIGILFVGWLNPYFCNSNVGPYICFSFI
ncbi:hypothetical protein F5880DRAFT_1183265 [Lentinula raphanica]|nr:hypothetical protein F5880DRAFT_1183265 [Lentinula raphanica]